ncbi:class I SAM-dependent methyltransferase [Candidatus Woesearchaeota archaeon]|nr:class I SAM-dependent methyltransferase [Candidatus Woesearchaeota archaeon]
MRNAALHEKYGAGAHWLQHPTEYGARFSSLVPESSTICDIGCSQGRDIRFFRAQGHSPVGIDISLPDLQQARPSVVAADAHLLPFSEATFSGLFMINVVHYLSNPEAAMREAYLALEQGGVIQLHVNRQIIADGVVDFETSEEEIAALVGDFRVDSTYEFDRHDIEPEPHTHKILELVLRK